METHTLENVVKDIEESERKRNPESNKFNPVAVDVGNLLVTDSNPVNLSHDADNLEDLMKSLSRDSVQILVNSVWKLASERVNNVSVAVLPEPTTVLPREKPIPKPTATTRWEEFAKRRGIKPRQKEKRLYDEELGRWVSRYGYEKQRAEREKNWLIEVPETADPFEDQFAKLEKEKSERRAKNELQRLRNISRSGKAVGVGVATADRLTSREQTGRALAAAGESDASMGRFTARTATEDRLVRANRGKKRRFPDNTGSVAEEKRRQLAVLEGLGKKGKLDVTRAVNEYVRGEDGKKAGSKRGDAGRKRGGGKMGEPRTVGSSKANIKRKQHRGKSHAGARIGKKEKAGRKRR